MNSNQWIDSYGAIYSVDKKRFIKFTNKDIKDYRIIPECEVIGEKAFHSGFGDDALLLQSIDIPNSITIIEKEAFCGCEYLWIINIPDSVTYISESAFELCMQLQRVYIPESVRVIEERAFANCFELKEVELSNGLISIGSDVFCITGLKSICIPETVQSVDFLFYGCINLQNIVCDSPYYKSLDGVLFTADLKTLIAYPPGKKDDVYEIPDSVTTIGDAAFSTCRNIKRIHLPSGLATIGIYAFYECDFEEIHIPDSVIEIDDSVFIGCGKLRNIFIDNYSKFQELLPQAHHQSLLNDNVSTLKNKKTI